MPPDDWTLGFDTSAAHCAAALLCGSRLVAERHEPMETGQAERLMPLLDMLLGEAGIGWRDLSAIGVGTGPGNFTGIRIAVAAARGLALSLGIPAVGIPAFAALAEGAPRPVLAAVDARRGQLWLARLEAEAAGTDNPEAAPAERAPAYVTSPDGAAAPRSTAATPASSATPERGEPAPVLASPEALPAALVGSGLAVIGHDAARLAALTGGVALSAAPLAPAIARLARARVRAGHPEPRPAPLYLRAADAAPPADPPPRILP